MTTSGYRAELVRLARTFTRTGFHDAAADAYRGWIEKLADALEASEAARRDAWEAVDVARAEAERQEAEKRRLIEAVRAEMHRYRLLCPTGEQWIDSAERLRTACTQAEEGP